MVKPFDTYFGGKNGSGVYQQIINCIRPHDVYMELFLGSGAIYRSKKLASVNVLNDIDPVVIERWFVSRIDVLNYDAIALLQNYAFDRSLQYCIYLDPPYPLSSRRSSIEVYNYEISEEQHERLLSVVTKLSSNVDVLISTYENDLYKRYLSNWQLKTFTGQTRQGPATEYLYMNYDNPTGLLHDYRYLGQDFTDRQRIKRKVEREIQKLNRLPASERNAIISGVLTSCTIDRTDFTPA